MKVTASGENKGDVEFTVQLDAEASGNLTVGTVGGGLDGNLGFTATISLDAQNDYKPDKLVLKGNGGYTGSLDTSVLLEADELKDVNKALKEVSLSSSQGQGNGFELSAELDLKDPDNLAATLNAITSQGKDVLPLALAIDNKGTIGFDTYDLDTEETEGSIKVGLGVGGGGGGQRGAPRSRADVRDRCDRPGGTFEPRAASSNPHPSDHPPHPPILCLLPPPRRSAPAAVTATT